MYTITIPLITEVARSVEYSELAGEDPMPIYRKAQRQVEAAIRDLRKRAREIKRLSRHTHRWNDNDYCSLCGADGHA